MEQSLLSSAAEAAFAGRPALFEILACAFSKFWIIRVGDTISTGLAHIEAVQFINATWGAGRPREATVRGGD